MDKIEKILTRSVEKVYPSREALESVLRSDKKVRIYFGIDPTGSLHIGHMVVLRKLKDLQELGHEIIVLIGDFTARIGDPTDKMATRKPLSAEEVENNAKNYKQLVGKILDIDHANLRFLHNEEWSNKLKPVDLLEIASNFTVQQLIERDMFQARLKAGREIYLHEFLYPVFQAYDSVTMDVDMEVGGNDQTFNMLAGRTLMKKMKNKEKMVLVTKLLVGSTGKKMSKSEGTTVMLEDSPKDMFGKIMAFPDELIIVGLELLTDKDQKEIDALKERMNADLNPKDIKMELAFDVVSQLYSKEQAQKEKEAFDRVHSQKEMPKDIAKLTIDADSINIVDLLIESELAQSKSEAVRLISQGGVRIDGEKITDDKKSIALETEIILQVGKLKYLKVKSGSKE